MNASRILIVAVLLSAASGAAVQYALAPGAPSPVQQAVRPRELDALARDLAALREEGAQLRDELETLRELGTAGRARAPVTDLDEVVRRVLVALEGARAAEPAQADQAARKPVADLLTELFALDDELARQQFWQRLRDEGRLDEVIAAFEARAAEAPDDPERQLQLGQAYLQKIQEVGSGPLAGVLATKADAAFDAALDADPEHWNARFHKAIALSFWPPVFGKQNEAIAQFELLVTQQASLAPSSEHAQTHLLLGNMYQQIGETAKAIAAWQAGLTIFPDDADLAAQLALVLGEGD